MPASVQLAPFRDPALVPVGEKVLNGRAARPRRCSGALRNRVISSDSAALAAYANELKNGDRVFFSANQHINPTNVCVLRNTCTFCSFARMPKEDGAYTRSLEEVLRTRPIRRRARRPASSTSSAGCTPSSG